MSSLFVIPRFILRSKRCAYSLELYWVESPNIGQNIPLNYEWIADKQRADELLANPNNLVEVVEWIEEPKVEKAIIEPKVEKAVKPRKRK